MIYGARQHRCVQLFGPFPSPMSRLTCFVAFCLLPLIAPAADVGMRIRFGLTDTGNTEWDGNVSLSHGTVERIDGWRFQDTDRVIDNSSWKAATRPLTVRRGNNAAKKAKQKANATGSLSDNGVFLVLAGVTETSVVSVETKQGKFDFLLSDIPYGKVIERLKGGVDVERVAASRPLSSQRDDDDFPALAVAPNGNSAVAWISFTPGIDRDERSRVWDKAPADFSLATT